MRTYFLIFNSVLSPQYSFMLEGFKVLALRIVQFNQSRTLKNTKKQKTAIFNVVKIYYILCIFISKG
ncbi:Uncharacterised protein [Legionella oakridgensis]|nr:Uncharacterised protein [Legionella oakridgensis]